MLTIDPPPRRRRPILFLALATFLALELLPQATLCHAQGGPVSTAASTVLRTLERVLSTPVARAALLETHEGRQTLRMILGTDAASVHAHLGPADLKRAALRLARTDAETLRLRNQFQVGLSELEREYRLKLREPYSEKSVPLPDRIDAGDLEGLAQRHLQISRLPNGELGIIGVRTKSVDPSVVVPHSFDHAVPIEHQSIEALLARNGEGVYQRLVSIEQRYFTDRMLLYPDEMAIALFKKNQQLPTLKDLLDQVVIERNAMAFALDRLATSILHRSPWAAKTIREAAKQIHVSRSRLLQFEQNSADAAKIIYRAGEDYPLFGGYTALLRGEMGELRVAMRLAEVTARGPSVREAIRALARNPKHLKTLSDEVRRLTPKRKSKFFNKELDIVLGHGRIWAEVKYFRTIFSTNHRKWADLEKQLLLTKEIKKRLESSPLIRDALGGPIELRIYFINGIRNESAVVLEDLGYRVLGPRF